MAPPHSPQIHACMHACIRPSILPSPHLPTYLLLSLLSVTCMYHGLGLTTETVATYEMLFPEDNWSSFPQQPSTPHSSSGRGRTLWALPMFLLQYCLVWSCAGDDGHWESLGAASALCPEDAALAVSLLAARVFLCRPYQAQSDQILLLTFTYSFQSPLA